MIREKALIEINRNRVCMGIIAAVPRPLGLNYLQTLLS